jgi:hypothetical protein
MAQTRGLLISMKFIKANSVIDNNVEDKLIQSTVWYCQKQYVEKLLGTELYNAIITEVTDNAGVIQTALYETLIDEYVADMLLKYVMFEVQIPLTYKMRNKSTGKNTDPNQQPVDFVEHRYLKDDYKDKAEYFADRAYRYLCANSEDYPLWSDCSDDGVNARELKPTTSLYLG